MTINSSGNVGIGTSSPASDTANELILQVNAPTTFPTLSLSTSRANVSGDNIGKLSFDVLNNTATYRSRAQITAQSAGSTANKYGADMIFFTASDNTTDAAERMRISAAGISVTGTVTTGGTVITDGSITDTGDFTIDVAGDIILDADGGDIRFKDGGTEFYKVAKNGDHVQLFSIIQDGDLTFNGFDGASHIVALTLDMSEAGEATFNSDIRLNDGKVARFGTDQDFRIGFNGTDAVLQNVTSDSDITFLGNDGGSTITALTLDMSAAGAATFNSDVTATTFSGSGASLTTLNGSNISTGTVAAARVATLNQNTTGSAATLTTARTINGVSFNGSANITITAAATNVNTQLASLGVGTAASGTAGEIRATNNVTAYYSDDRLKTKLGNIEGALDLVGRLNGFYYEANQTAVDLGYEVKREVGVSAQEVEAIMPEIVAPAPIDDRYLTVRYERLAPLLIEAIKELKDKVESLEAQLREK
jgi:hypothetical protein